MNTRKRHQTMNTNTREAYKLGLTAGRNRLTPPSNPYDYDEDEPNFTSWEEGYMYGYPEHLKLTRPSR
jgi:hypothetical protein